MDETRFDVVIIGAGLAGLTLARQLLMREPLRVLHLEKRATVPPVRQKVGESNVQIQGYYLGKVLELEEYLFHEHFMKYNLRFLWRTPGRSGADITDYSQSYIRKFSNIPAYQLDRNKLEGELIRLNRDHETYRLETGFRDLSVDLRGDERDHEISYRVEGAHRTAAAAWVIDATGRARVLARDKQIRLDKALGHSAAFFWVDGTVNIERLTRADNASRRRDPSRRAMGHLPFWLATNHFMGDGYWFWVIPLKGRTSFGLVFDNEKIPPRAVSTERAFRAWSEENLPLFAEFLADQTLIDFSVIRDYAHDCERTIHRDRWAMTGESGRFSDPLYSPGGDLISIHNTLITDAIFTRDPKTLSGKVGTYETLLKVFFQSFIPSYTPGYDCLDDQETFAMKYTWELAIYFAFFVFPFINDLYTERHFLIPFFRRLARLGEMNRKVHNTLARFSQWKRSLAVESREPIYFDFTSIETLARAEKTFYLVDLEPREAIRELDRQLVSLCELARYIVAHVTAAISGRAELRTDAGFITSIDLDDARPEDGEGAVTSGETYPWRLDGSILPRTFHHRTEPELSTA